MLILWLAALVIGVPICAWATTKLLERHFRKFPPDA